MRLFLMRHATAESGEGKEDFARILTPSGEEEAKKDNFGALEKIKALEEQVRLQNELIILLKKDRI